MNENREHSIVEILGEDVFLWMTKSFDRETRLQDVPEEILERLSAVDITVRNYEEDRNSITAIALITFSFLLAQKDQRATDAPTNIALLKVLAKNEKARRAGEKELKNAYWDLPLYDLVTGDVGGEIRRRSPLA